MRLLEPFLLPTKKASFATRLKRYKYTPKTVESAGTVTFYWDNATGQPLFLQFLCRFDDGFTEWWFPKGHIEKTDSSKEYRAAQETKEEVGLEVSIVTPLTPNRFVYYWDPTREKTTKTVYYYLAQSVNKDVSFSRFNTDQKEINAFKEYSWSTLSDAMEKTKHRNEKQMLQEGYDWIHNNLDKINKN